MKKMQLSVPDAVLPDADAARPLHAVLSDGRYARILGKLVEQLVAPVVRHGAIDWDFVASGDAFHEGYFDRLWGKVGIDLAAYASAVLATAAGVHRRPRIVTVPVVVLDPSWARERLDIKAMNAGVHDLWTADFDACVEATARETLVTLADGPRPGVATVRAHLRERLTRPCVAHPIAPSADALFALSTLRHFLAIAEEETRDAAHAPMGW